MLAAILILMLLLFGVDNAEKLNGSDGPAWPWYLRAHPTQVIQNALVFAAALSGGYDLAEALGIMLVGDALFQIPINLRYGWSVFDRREGKTWELGRLDVPKFYGKGRIFEIVLGLALLFHSHLTELYHAYF